MFCNIYMTIIVVRSHGEAFAKQRKPAQPRERLLSIRYLDVYGALQPPVFNHIAKHCLHTLLLSKRFLFLNTEKNQ